MKNLLLTLLFLPLFAFAQPVICDEDSVPISGMTLPTLRPIVQCPFDTGFVFWWGMAAPGGGGDGAYFHSMQPFTDGAYHLGVDDSHLLSPSTGWCFICVEGTDYNAVGAAWGVADSAGGFTPSPDCTMVPEYNYTHAHPWSRFDYDEPFAEALGERWTIWRSNNPDFTAPYQYATPRSNYNGWNGADGFPFWSNAYGYVKVLFTFENGTQCTEVLDFTGLRTAPIGFDGQPKERIGFYIENRQLKFGN